MDVVGCSVCPKFIDGVWPGGRKIWLMLARVKHALRGGHPRALFMARHLVCEPCSLPSGCRNIPRISAFKPEEMSALKIPAPVVTVLKKPTISDLRVSLGLLVGNTGPQFASSTYRNGLNARHSRGSVSPNPDPALAYWEAIRELDRMPLLGDGAPTRFLLALTEMS